MRVSKTTSNFTVESVRKSYEILGSAVGIHPQLAAESVDVTARLTPVIEASQEIGEEEFEEFRKNFKEFLETEEEKGVNPLIIPLWLWLALLPAQDDQNQRGEHSDPMFV